MSNSEKVRLLAIKEELELLIAAKSRSMINEMSGSLNDGNSYNYLQRLNSELGSINKKLSFLENQNSQIKTR